MADKNVEDAVKVATKLMVQLAAIELVAESVAEYMDPLFPAREIIAARKAVREYIEETPNRRKTTRKGRR